MVNLDFLKIKKWKLATGSAIGLSHEKNLIPCQDFAEAIDNGNIKSIALADGAGSKKHSDIGARAIVKEVNTMNASNFEKLINLSETELVEEYKNFITLKINETAKKYSIDINDLSSTLLFTATNGEKFIIGHLGDGAIASINSMHNINLQSAPQNAEYVNQTYFTTNTNLEKHLRIKVDSIKNIIGFILMSDGSADSLFSKQNNKFSSVLIDICDWLNYYPEKVVSEAITNNLMETLRFKTSDDCSLAIMCKPNEIGQKDLLYPFDIIFPNFKKNENSSN